jgi:choice-of-anchor A domain-containing protein
MRKLPVIILTMGLMGSFAVEYANADALSLGLGYNLVALSGNINYSGPDIEGGIAAAGNINFNAQQSWQTLSVGSKLTPSTNAPNAIVAGGSVSALNGAHITVNGGGANPGGGSVSGNVVSGSTSSPSTFYASPGSPIANSGGSLSTGNYWTASGLSSLNKIAKFMSDFYVSMPSSGTVAINKSTGFLDLNAGSPSSVPNTYVFDITAQQFSSTTHALSINFLPPGATVVINVNGCDASTACMLNTTPTLNGQQFINGDYSHIVFNFTDPKTTAQILTIPNWSQSTSGNGTQLDGFILAPYATLEGGGDVGGTIWVASDASSGEIHSEGYTGYTPSLPHSVVTPEPGTLGLMGTGVLFLAGLLRFRMRS